MAATTPPSTARLHAAVARALEWVWPAGAPWAWADAIARAPRDPELRFFHGRALGRAGRWAEAARSFAAATRLKPASAEYQGTLVLALHRAGRERQLVEALSRFAELRPGEGEVHVLIGAVLRRGGRHGEALKAFRLAVRLAPSPGSRRFALGEMVLGERGWKEALDAWQEARQLEAPAGPAAPRPDGQSALNFHPGRHLHPVPRRPARPKRRGVRARLRDGWSGLLAYVRALVHGRPRRAEDRVRAIRRAWRRAHPGAVRGRAAGPAPPPSRVQRRRDPGEAA